MYYPRFTKVIIHYFLTQDKAVSWRNKIGMHTSRDDYLINTLRFVSAKEATQIYGAILPETLTSPKMKETKAYKTYLVSPKEPTGKSNRVKRPAKKSTKAPARGVVIRESPEMPLSKKKEKMTLEKRKGIDLLSEIIPYVTNEGTSVKPGVPDVIEEESSESEAESWGNDEDDRNNDHDSSGEDSDQENDSDDDKTQSDNENELDSEHETDENESSSESNQEENEEDIGDDKEGISDKAEGDEDEEMDYTTSQLYNDVDKPVQADDEMVQEEGTDAELTNIQQGNENPEISHHRRCLYIPHTDAEIVIIDSSPVYSTVIPQSLPSFTPPPQQSTSTPPPTTKATNPPSTLPDFASVFQFNNRVLALEKDVFELKKDDPLKTQVTTLVDKYLDARLGATRYEFMSYLSASITARITEQVKN
ncbi:hypothetical protein Tco_0151199 [Tanacetum coccineum]